jgi:hypothetical protein
MLASILHAQCLLSCSIQTPVHANTVLNVQSGEHSCCPHQSDQQNQSSEKPCRTDTPAINLAANEVTTANVVLPVTMSDQPDSIVAPTLHLQASLLPAASQESSTSNLLSSISILRI